MMRSLAMSWCRNFGYRHIRRLTALKHPVVCDTSSSAVTFNSCSRRIFSSHNIRTSDSCHVRSYATAAPLDSKDRPFKTDWPIHSVRISTSHLRWYDKEEGLEFHVKYLDTGSGPIDTKQTPTIVALHGGPGSHVDFLPIIEKLVNQGVRFICPNFPGFGQTKGVTSVDDDIFFHSNEERAEFIGDFLARIGYKNRCSPDMLLAHSAGAYPAARIVGKTGTNLFKSLCLIAPCVHRPHRATQPFWAMELFVKLWEYKFLRPLLGLMGKMMSRKAGFKGTPIPEIVSVVFVVEHPGYRDIGGFATAIGLHRTPLVHMYSRDDKIVELDIQKEYRSLLGISEKAVCQVNKEGKIEKEGEISSDHYARALEFERGSHNIHCRHPDLVVNEIMDLLNHVRKSNK